MEAKQLLELVKRYHDNREFIGNEETPRVALHTSRASGAGWTRYKRPRRK